MTEELLPPCPTRILLTPEFRLLAACSWLAPPPFEEQQREVILACIATPINWELFVTQVNVHGIQPQAYTLLNRFAKDRVPAAILATLRTKNLQICGQSLYHVAELTRISAICASQRIDLLPLKGTILSLQLYGDPGKRNSCDIDILVKPEHLEETCNILESEGYRSAIYGLKLTHKQKAYIRENLYHLEFVNDARRIKIELHWNLGALWLPEHTALVWDNIQPIEWMDTRINILSKEVLLLVLCDHGARHRFCCLKWLGDISRLLTAAQPLDWTYLLACAKTLDLQRTLFHTLLLTHWIHGTPIPYALQTLIHEDPSMTRLSKKVLELLVRGAAGPTSLGKRLGGALLGWQIKRLRPTIPLRVVVNSTVIAPADFHSVPLPDSLFWLYYLLRPFTWLRRYNKP